MANYTPTSTSFKKGNTAAKGIRKKPRFSYKAIREAFAFHVDDQIIFLRNLLDQAKDGNMQAAKLWVEKIMPFLVTNDEGDCSMDLTERVERKKYADSCVNDYMNGEITSLEAINQLEVIEKYQSVITVPQVEADILVIKEAMKSKS